MYAKVLKYVFNLGIDKDTPTSLRPKIKLTNQINFFLLLTAVLFASTAALIGNSSTFSLLYIALTLVLIGLNGLGYHVASRAVSSTFPVFFTTIVHALKVPAGLPPIAGSYLLTASLMVLPFVLFDAREQIRITITSAINVLSLLSLPFLSTILSAGVKYKELMKVENQMLYFVVAAAILVGLNYVLAHGQKKEIENARTAIKDMQESKQETELAQKKLKESMKALEAAKQKDRNQNWISESIGLFAEVMRIESEKGTFYDTLISKIVHRIGLNQAAIFIIENQEEDNSFLRMEACFAYGRKKFIQKEIQIGEGMAGQVARTREKIFITDVPDAYMNIQSGLGEGKPNCILILPLMINEVVEGVLEMASFKVIELHEIEFMERLASNIATIINGKRTTNETQKLLQSSQKTAQGLQSKIELLERKLHTLENLPSSKT